MTVHLREVRDSLRAYPGFATAVLIALGLAGLIGLMTFLMILRPGFLGMAHFSEADHRVHDLTYGFLFATAVVGMLAQLRRPSNNVAGMLVALIPWVALLLAAVLSTDPGVALSAERILVATGTVTAALLHPARGDFLRSLRLSRVNRIMLALVIIAAVPLIAFTSTNIGLQRTTTDDHAAAGHYGFMAAFSFTVIAAGLLASLRPVGWRLTAWVAGLLPAFLGLISVVYPDASSSLSGIWAIAAIAWGAVFVVAAELTRRRESPTMLGSRAAEVRSTTTRHNAEDRLADSPRFPEASEVPDRGSTGTPRWVLGIIALVAILLLVIVRVIGMGGEHGGASPVADDAREIAVTANNLAFNPNAITVTAGEDIAIVLTSVDTLHDITIDELDAHVAAEQSETEAGGFRADRPGRYTFYCGVSGHRQAGMEGKLTVKEATTSSSG